MEKLAQTVMLKKSCRSKAQLSMQLYLNSEKFNE